MSIAVSGSARAVTTNVSPPLISVQNVLHLLAHTGLLSAADAHQLGARWFQDAGAAVNNVVRFRDWLLHNQYVTEYQADRLFRGHTDYYHLNQYKLLERIGKGRMAGVYKAVHQLGQVVAIKVLPPSKARDANAFARFCREARLARRLQHINVVRTFQTGECNGLYYLVMEHLDGETLEEVLTRRGQLPPREAVRILYHALQGLEHIHEKGLVHRDLEPGNLMLIPARQPGQPDTTLNATVKILDIGLGRSTFDEGVGPRGTQLTADETILGTPYYMAPEQARNSHTADIRSDLYSLGCVFYHAVAGQPPFPEKLAVRAMIRHATEVPKPLRQFNPDIPDSLQQFTNILLAKEPSKRYATPKEASQALRRFIGSTQLVRPAADTSPVQAYVEWAAANPEPGQQAAAPALSPTAAWQPAPSLPVPSSPPAPFTAPAPAAPPPAYMSAPAASAPRTPSAPAAIGEPTPAPQQLDSMSDEVQGDSASLAWGDWLFLVIGAIFLMTIVLVAWWFLRS